jgi:hypothetical protein
MYTTKEIQDMFQIDAIVEKSKEIAKQSIDFSAILSNASIAYFDAVTDRKFTTYTEQAKKGVDQTTNAAEKFIDGFAVPQVSGSGSKN